MIQAIFHPVILCTTAFLFLLSSVGQVAWAQQGNSTTNSLQSLTDKEIKIENKIIRIGGNMRKKLRESQ